MDFSGILFGLKVAWKLDIGCLGSTFDQLCECEIIFKKIYYIAIIVLMFDDILTVILGDWISIY